MSAEGFRTADLAVTYLLDPKFARLRRKVTARQYPLAVLTHLQTLLASWAEARRLTAEEAENSVPVDPAIVTALVGVGLLDEQHRIPEQAWLRHAGTALNRHASQVRGGYVGAARRWAPDGSPIGNPKVPIGLPGGREGGTAGGPRARAKAPTKMRDAMKAAGWDPDTIVDAVLDGDDDVKH